MIKNHSKILIFDAGIGYDVMDDFFIESSNHEERVDYRCQGKGNFSLTEFQYKNVVSRDLRWR